MAKKKNSLFDVYVMMDDPEIRENTEKEIRFRFVNRAGRHLWCSVRICLPEGWGQNSEQSYACWLNEYASGSEITDKTIRVPVPTLTRDKYTVDVMITANGYPTQMHIPLTLIRE